MAQLLLMFNVPSLKKQCQLEGGDRQWIKKQLQRKQKINRKKNRISKGFKKRKTL